MPEIADIFRRYGDDYLHRFGANILPSHRRAMRDLRACRTEAMGGQLYRCDRCGGEQYVYHSCRNRACPKCHGRDTEAWLAQRRKDLLPVPYFHVVFTVPEQLRQVIRRDQKTLYPLLIRAAAKALIKLAADPHYVGGLVGVMAILHTWGRTLAYHPHVHCLVPGGGLDDDGQWRSARTGKGVGKGKSFLVPVKALSKLFRGLFMDLVGKALPDAAIPRAALTQPWVVYCKRTFQGAEKVLTYLGRYVHRVAITNRRIVSIDGGNVTFRYKNVGQKVWRTMTLGASEFLRRFLQHVLPKGLHKIRYYGLWAPANRKRLQHLQAILAPHADAAADAPVEETGSPSRIEGSPCPFCSSGRLVLAGRILCQGRSPP